MSGIILRMDVLEPSPNTTHAVVDNTDSMDDRDRTAVDRDRTAEALDEIAMTRDLRSEDRDSRAEARDEREGTVDIEAASDRAGARRDRKGAAADRRQAEADRDAADVDRQLSAVHRASLVLDELTGVYRREVGLAELERELVSAARSEEPFVLAFIDVDGLKAVNDSAGHKAGDLMLRRVADAIRAVVREEDVILRFGGDEFVCGLLGVDLDEATRRFVHFGKDPQKSLGLATCGLVQLQPGEELTELIERADACMYEQKSAADSVS
ncbi:MAG: GGDEF domain-containing protein [Actinomycetota bacterium]|nr:GGDEF domain-containing protein [Actinomycetota bacterium]MDP2288301.1 GGDEF domain-containing protein [Actinomycetota bacterium]